VIDAVGPSTPTVLNKSAGEPICISALRRSRSSSLSVTTYFFTATHFAVTMLLRHCDSENRRGINDEGDWLNCPVAADALCAWSDSGPPPVFRQHGC
jgi:hypothetical protein